MGYVRVTTSHQKVLLRERDKVTCRLEKTWPRIHLIKDRYLEHMLITI